MFRSLTAIGVLGTIVAALFAVTLPVSAQGNDRGELERDLEQFEIGWGPAYREAADRLIARGEPVVPDIVTRLSSDSIRTRQRAVRLLHRFGDPVVEEVKRELLQTIREGNDTATMSAHVTAWGKLGDNDSLLRDALLARLAQVRSDELVFYTLLSLASDAVRACGMTAEQADAMSRIRLGALEQSPRRELWYWRAGLICIALLENAPDALIVFLEEHPGALAYFREDEPMLINLFADATPETQALRDYLVKREDLPPMFEIDRDQGERVGVVRTHAGIGEEIGRYKPGYLSLVVRGNTCDLPRSPLPDGSEIRFGHGLTVIEVDGLYGYTDPAGQIMIEPVFNAVSEFWFETTWVCVDDRWGMINLEGEFLIEPRFDSFIPAFDESFDVVFEDEWMGVVRRDGTFFIEPIYADIRVLSHGPVVFRGLTSEGIQGVFDAEGNFIPDAE